MKLSPAQHGTLHALAAFGPQTATEVQLPPAMDGKRRVKLEWSGGNPATLAVLEGGGLVHVVRTPIETPRNAVGKPGHKRRGLTITITDAGRKALAEE